MQCLLEGGIDYTHVACSGGLYFRMVFTGGQCLLKGSISWSKYSTLGIERNFGIGSEFGLKFAWFWSSDAV